MIGFLYSEGNSVAAHLKIKSYAGFKAVWDDSVVESWFYVELCTATRALPGDAIQPRTPTATEVEALSSRAIDLEERAVGWQSYRRHIFVYHTITESEAKYTTTESETKYTTTESEAKYVQS